MKNNQADGQKRFLPKNEKLNNQINQDFNIFFQVHYCKEQHIVPSVTMPDTQRKTHILPMTKVITLAQLILVNVQFYC